jgi:hypothetical protein
LPLWEPEISLKGRHHLRPRRGQDKNDLKEIGCEGIDWIRLAQDRINWLALVSSVMSLRVPYKADNFLTSWETSASQEPPWR